MQRYSLLTNAGRRFEFQKLFESFNSLAARVVDRCCTVRTNPDSDVRTKVSTCKTTIRRP
jgi:hypothetical protein